MGLIVQLSSPVILPQSGSSGQNWSKLFLRPLYPHCLTFPSASSLLQPDTRWYLQSVVQTFPRDTWDKYWTQAPSAGLDRFSFYKLWFDHSFCNISRAQSEDWSIYKITFPDQIGNVENKRTNLSSHFLERPSILCTILLTCPIRYLHSSLYIQLNHIYSGGIVNINTETFELLADRGESIKAQLQFLRITDRTE